MEIQTQAVHFTIEKNLLDFIEKKVKKLESFYESIISAEIFLKIDKAKSSQENKIVEVKLNIPNQILFSSQSAFSFEEGINSVVRGLKRKLRKHKEKLMQKY